MSRYKNLSSNHDKARDDSVIPIHSLFATYWLLTRLSTFASLSLHLNGWLSSEYNSSSFFGDKVGVRFKGEMRWNIGMQGLSVETDISNPDPAIHNAGVELLTNSMQVN